MPPRKRAAPRTRPTVETAVRRAERDAPTEPLPRQPEPPVVRVRADDPPTYRDAWNVLYALEHGAHPADTQEVTDDTGYGV